MYYNALQAQKRITVKKILYALLFLGSPLCASQKVKPKALLLDLGGIFFKFSKYRYTRQLGLLNIVSYALRDIKNPAGIKDILFDVLANAAIKKDETLIPTCSPQGDVFDPEIHATFSYPIEEGTALLHELKAQKKYKLIGLTNWDGYSFDIVKDTYPEAFEPFDEIIVSGKVGRLKPNKDAFQAVLDEYNLTKEECVFLDDQPENIMAAREFGIPSILFKNYYQTRKELHELGVLPEGPTGFSPREKQMGMAALVLCLSCLGYYFLG